jgi:isoleucyl-tRNA synthetase
MYLEGSDQHRGWFQSSLLVGSARAAARRTEACSRTVRRRRRRPKDVEVARQHVAPQDVIKQSGAEILRLWVAMVDYRRKSGSANRSWRESSRRTGRSATPALPGVESVRLRSCCRSPAGRPARGSRPLHARALCGRRSQIVAAYDDYEFPAIFQAVNSFATVELSALYSDISKDRLYTFAARSRERRSAQTAMYTIADGLTRLLAPFCR